MTTVVFSHGKESGPWGTKIQAMADLVKALGCGVDSIDYQGMADPTDRVNKLIAVCGDIDDSLVLVGSSRVATSVRVSVGALRHESVRAVLPPEGIDIRKVGYVETQDPPYAVTATGMWPDPLTEATETRAIPLTGPNKKPAPMVMRRPGKKKIVATI